MNLNMKTRIISGLRDIFVRSLGLGFASLLALLSADLFLSIPEMSGRRYLVFKHDETSREVMQDQVTVYELVLIQSDKAISGKGESHSSRDRNGKEEKYGGEVQGKVTGYIIDKFIKDDKINFVYEKEGAQRTAHYFFTFTETSDGIFEDDYTSTAADAAGRAELVTDLGDSKLWGEK